MNVEDRISVLILIFLYTIQAIPMGLSASIPLILKEKGLSYEALSVFSMVSLPFSLKILWAPIVDSYFSPYLGRRKSWIVPVQILTGFMMIHGSYLVSEWIAAPNENIIPFTAFFFLLYFFMATQDIAVDGWALTMLSKESLGWASICNSLGQTLGIFFANQVFLALSDPDWCMFFLSRGPLIDLESFMLWCGIGYIISTIAIAIFKTDSESIFEERQDVLKSYRDTIQLCSLPSVSLLIMILLLSKFSFSPLDSALVFKFQEYGLTKSDIATFSPLFVVSNFLVPAVFSKLISQTPLQCFIAGIKLKMCLAFLSILIICLLPNLDTEKWVERVLMIGLLLCSDVFGTLVFSSIMSFFSKVSDPLIGGTCMTLFNTAMNLGSKWPTTLSLWIIPKLTFQKCEILANQQIVTIEGLCTEAGSLECSGLGGNCRTSVDGYVLLSGILLLVGLLWVGKMKDILYYLQDLPASNWRIVNKSN